MHEKENFLLLFCVVIGDCLVLMITRQVEVAMNCVRLLSLLDLLAYCGVGMRLMT